MLLPGCGFGGCHMRIDCFFAGLRKQQRDDCPCFHSLPPEVDDRF
jgi:hypothetical protein